MSVKIGFLLLTVTPVDSHLLLLLDRLSEFHQSKIVIHHDEQQGGEFPDEIVQKYNISLVKPCYRTHWSHINNVMATIEGFKLLYNSDVHLDWFLTLTPSCYPIKSIDYIQKFYDNCQFDALVEMTEVSVSSQDNDLHRYIVRDFSTQPWIKIPFITRKGKFYWRNIRKAIDVRMNPFFEKYRTFHGSNWFSINRFVVKQIIDLDVMHGDLVQFYKQYIVSQPNMHPCPQEIVLPTFIASIPDVKIDYQHYRYINWQGTSNWSPNTLDLSVLNEIKTSKAHWARKFQVGISDELVLKINLELLGHSLPE